LPIAEQIAAALTAAHAAGIIHRDLKCSNVILVKTPRGLRSVVTDMGLARLADGGGDQLTGDGVVGSPAYMAPEQVEGGHRLTAACDLYAFGVVLYEMVTGRLPFVAETPLATAMMRLREPPPTPRAVVPDLDPRWERAILACLARAPEARPAEAQDVLGLLRPVSATAARRRRVLVAAAAAFAALAILAGWYWRNTARARWARAIATPEVDRLLADEEYAQAATLARRALAVIPGDATLERLWTKATLPVISVDSTPAGADVLYRPYRSAPQSFTPWAGRRCPGSASPRARTCGRYRSPAFCPPGRSLRVMLRWRGFPVASSSGSGSCLRPMPQPEWSASPAANSKRCSTGSRTRRRRLSTTSSSTATK
jgi:hypothetical protein